MNRRTFFSRLAGLTALAVIGPQFATEAAPIGQSNIIALSEVDLEAFIRHELSIRLAQALDAEMNQPRGFITMNTSTFQSVTLTPKRLKFGND